MAPLAASQAGDKQLLTFLSGQGGTGKSTLIRLLTAYWRSEGLNVLLTGSSGKAARLIGGVTVHSAFALEDASGLFMRMPHAAQSFAHIRHIDHRWGRPGRPPECPDGRRTAPTDVSRWG